MTRSVGRPRSRTVQRDGLDLSIVHDPQMVSRNRLPMRSTGMFTESLDEARLATRSKGLERIIEPALEARSMVLDGEWRFKIFDSPSEVSADDLDGSAAESWQTIEVPGAWTLQPRGAASDATFDRPHYTNVVMPFDGEPPSVPEQNRTGLYRRSVRVPANMENRRIILRLGSAESVAEVFVDGRSVGAATDSRLPSEFELDVEAGDSFELLVAVTRYSAQSWLEDQDQWWHGGIQRSVTLHAVPDTAIVQVKSLPGLESADGRSVGTLDLEVRVDGEARVEPGWTIEARVEERTAGKSKGTTLVATPRLAIQPWDSSSEAASVISAMYFDPGVIRERLRVPDVEPWSHERPRLYRLLVELRDPKGRLVHVYGTCTGFRSVEVRSNELLINGAPVLINGVNLHEHSLSGGRFVTASQTAAALEKMKRFNINAVRAAHYPHDEHLAELCDELGLYLVDEANVESHGRQISLCHDERFTTSIVQRIARMAQRDQHHPSVIIWSLGNESGYGPVHDGAAAWLRRYDPSRPIQYEAPFMHDLHAEAPVSDIVCPMYSEIDDIVRWSGEKHDDRRPLILCEYSHAMGNSNGSLSDYWEAFESHLGLQGGFIWEWTDHGLLLMDSSGAPLAGPGGTPAWGYGGDFGDKPNDSNFVCDGLVSAIGDARPALEEVAFLGRPVAFGWTAPVSGTGPLPRIAIENRRWFSDTSDLAFEWVLRCDGVEVGSGNFEPHPIGARKQASVPSPVRRSELRANPSGAEVHLDLIARLKKKTPWADAGHVVSTQQLQLSEPTAGRPVSPLGPLDQADQLSEPPEVRNTAAGFAEATWQPTIFRALTDNDGLRSGWMRGLSGNLARWIDLMGLDRCEWNETAGELTCGNGETVVVTRTIIEPSGRWERLGFGVRIPPTLADLPRVGFEWKLPEPETGGRWASVEWMGEGPHECYPDRRASTRVGIWRSTIEDFYVDYAVPQEHGNREGLRWLALASEDGRRGVMIIVDSFDGGSITDAARPSFAVRSHDDMELWSASHTNDLGPFGSAATYLYLNVDHRGVGTASCGPDTLNRYRLGHGTAQISLAVTAFDPRDESPAELYSAFTSALESGGVDD